MQVTMMQSTGLQPTGRAQQNNMRPLSTGSVAHAALPHTSRPVQAAARQRCGAVVSPAQAETFRDQGFLVLEDFAELKQVQALKAQGEELIRGFEPESSPSFFSTKNQKSTSNDYFAQSANNISFFFEEKAFDDNKKLRQDKTLSINKVGHAMHDLDPIFRGWSRSPKVAQLLQDLGFQQPLPVQSMLILKNPKIGGEVVPHQDSTFLFTDPPTVLGLWLALEDATEENGCLHCLPKSHVQGPHRRMTTLPEGGITFDQELPEYDLKAFQPVPVKAGSLVLLHGANVHFSYENSSPHSRHAYSMHVIEGAKGVTYPADNWLQRRPDFPFEPLLVDGQQPSAQKAPVSAQLKRQSLH